MVGLVQFSAKIRIRATIKTITEQFILKTEDTKEKAEATAAKKRMLAGAMITVVLNRLQLQQPALPSNERRKMKQRYWVPLETMCYFYSFSLA